jgi:putative FmdB family regulatory protein
MPIFEYNCEKCNHTFDKLVMQQDTKVGASNNGSSELPAAPPRPMCGTC